MFFPPTPFCRTVQASFPNILFRNPKVVAPKAKTPEKPAEVKLINVVEYKPGQITGIVNTKTFDEEGFVALATNYQVSGDHPMQLCQNNMRIAQEQGREESVQFWKIIELFLLTDQTPDLATDGLDKEPVRKSIFMDDEPPRQPEDQHSDAGGFLSFSFLLPGCPFHNPNPFVHILVSQNTDIETNGTQPSDYPSPDSSDEETQFLPSLKKETSPAKLAKSDTAASKQQEAIVVALSALVYPEWDHKPIIQEMLEYFAEIVSFPCLFSTNGGFAPQFFSFLNFSFINFSFLNFSFLHNREMCKCVSRSCSSSGPR